MQRNAHEQKHKGAKHKRSPSPLLQGERARGVPAARHVLRPQFGNKVLTPAPGKRVQGRQPAALKHCADHRLSRISLLVWWMRPCARVHWRSV